HDAHRVVSGIGLLGLGDHLTKRALGLAHRLGLLAGGGEVVTSGDRLALGDLSALVIDDDLRELVCLHRVHRELELAVLELELSRDRTTFLLRRLQAAGQRDLRLLGRGRERRRGLRRLALLGLLVGFPFLGRGGDGQNHQYRRQQSVLHLDSSILGFVQIRYALSADAAFCARSRRRCTSSHWMFWKKASMYFAAAAP